MIRYFLCFIHMTLLGSFGSLVGAADGVTLDVPFDETPPGFTSSKRTRSQRCISTKNDDIVLSIGQETLSAIPFSSMAECERAVAIAPEGFYLEPRDYGSGRFRVLPLPPLVFESNFGGYFSLTDTSVESAIGEYLRTKYAKTRIMQSAFLAASIFSNSSVSLFDPESIRISALERYRDALAVTAKMMTRTPAEFLDGIGLIEGWDGQYSVPSFFATSSDGIFGHHCLYRYSHISEDRALLVMRRPLCETWIADLQLLLERAPSFFDQECQTHLRSLMSGDDVTLDIKPNRVNIKPASERFSKFYNPPSIKFLDIEKSSRVCSQLIATAVRPVLSIFKRNRVEFSESNFERVQHKYSIPD